MNQTPTERLSESTFTQKERGVMNSYRRARIVFIAILSIILLSLLSATVFAQTTKIQGMIKGRTGATMIVQTPDASQVVVLLTDKTHVGQIEGMLQVRRKEMSMAELIPGLEIQVEGSYNGLNQLEAAVIKFKGNDLERARSIQAGLHETQAKAQRNTEELEKQNAELKTHAETLTTQNENLKQQQAQLTAQQEKINANRAAIKSAMARFGQLDDYYILDELTVYFGNGKAGIDPEYKPQLVKLSEKAKTIEAYNIQVVGYASSAGSAAMNQKLSEERAGNITNFLVQDCNVPLLVLLAPGAMGESRQVGNDKTVEGQAQNRRVVVRVLQNKGIAGLQNVQ
jgi:outer membrane protein OmpA-like peptidoglycan-associated protein